MRLEHLFRQATYLLAKDDHWSSRLFIMTLLDILELFARGDIKTELLKELERSTESLGLLMQYPGVDQERLGSILRALEHLIDNIHGMTSTPGHELKIDELLAIIRQRSTIPGGTCDFDLPRFNYWLHQDFKDRHTDQKRWYATMDPIRQTIELLLKMVRGSAEFVEKDAITGNHTEQLEKDTPFQMIRVRLPDSATCFTEISGGRHCFTIRFLEPSDTGKPRGVNYDVTFQLALCRL